MKAFTDSAGRTWSFSITIDSIRRVKELLGINITEVDAGTPPLLVLIGTDELTLINIVFCLIKPQADERGVTDEEFGRHIDGAAILGAQTALYEEFTDFFLSRGRPDRAKAVTAQKKMMELAVENGRANLEAAVEAEMKKISSGNASTSLPV